MAPLSLKSLFGRAARAAPPQIADAIGDALGEIVQVTPELESGVREVNAGPGYLQGDKAFGDLLRNRFWHGPPGEGGFGAFPLAGGISDLVANEVRAFRYIAEATARNLVNQHPLLAWGVNLSIDMMLGQGLDPCVMLDHERLNITEKQAEDLSFQMEQIFRAWASSTYSTSAADINFHAAVETMLRRSFATGSMCVKFDWKPDRMGRFATCVQPIDTNRIARTAITAARDGNRIIDGLEISWPVGRLEAVHILPYLPLGTAYNSGPEFFGAQPIRVPTRGMFDRPEVVFATLDKAGPGVLHGISPIAAAILSACAADEHQSVTLRSAAARAAVVFAIQTDLPPEEAIKSVVGGDPGLGGDHEDGGPDAMGELLGVMSRVGGVSFRAQTVSVLPIGSKLTVVGADPDAKQFDAFNRAILTNIARGFGITYAQLTSDLADESFSASRINNAAPWSIAARRRERSIVPIYQAAFRAVIEEAYWQGLLKVPKRCDPYADIEAFFGAVEFSGPVSPSLDPAKETTADVEALAAGLTSRAQIAKRRGTDHRQIFRELAAEKRQAAALGLELETVQPQLQKVPEQIQPPAPAPKPGRRQPIATP